MSVYRRRSKKLLIIETIICKFKFSFIILSNLQKKFIYKKYTLEQNFNNLYVQN